MSEQQNEMLANFLLNTVYYASNVSQEDFIEDMYDGISDHYSLDKFKQFRTNFIDYFSSLDAKNKQKFVSCVLERYKD